MAYCNCDDPRVSKFFEFFSKQFEWYRLKKLIATCYKNQQPDLFSQHDSEKAVYLEYYGDQDGNCRPDPHEIHVKPLKGDGDFRSAECIELLKEADIVVTNPPFSLFREYVAQLMEYDKKFLIIGNMNAITYKEIFPLIMQNKIWLGYGTSGQNMLFDAPDEFAKELVETKKEGSAYRMVDGIFKGRLGNAYWFTNLPHPKHNDELIIYKRYTPKEYPHYDNYVAIEVSKTLHIPVIIQGLWGFLFPWTNITLISLRYLMPMIYEPMKLYQPSLTDLLKILMIRILKRPISIRTHSHSQPLNLNSE